MCVCVCVCVCGIQNIVAICLTGSVTKHPPNPSMFHCCWCVLHTHVPSVVSYTLQQQESYHKQFQGYYEKKMEELMEKLSQQEEANREKKTKDKKKKKKSVVISDSSDDELVPAVHSLKQEILQHKEAKEHQAQIHHTEMLTEKSVKEYSEARIPAPPPLPPQSYLLKTLQRLVHTHSGYH